MAGFWQGMAIVRRALAGAAGRLWQRWWLSVAMLIVVGACQSAASEQLKIGTLLPITGDLEQYGTSMQNAASLLVKTVNNCGGVLGKSVVLVAEDDQTDPAAGTSAMTKLAEVDRVAGVVGASSSAVSSAALSIAVRNQTVMISPSATSPTFSDRARKGEFNGFWFRTAPPDNFQGQALAKLARARGIRTVALLAVNNDYGNGLISAFVPAYEAIGGRVVNRAAPVRYAPNASTFDTEVITAFKEKPDAVLLIAYPETGSLAVKAAYEQGLLGKKTQLLLTDGMKEPGIGDRVGINRQGKYLMEGMVGTAASAGGPAIAAFQKNFETEFGRSSKIYDANTWDAAALLVLAAEASKSVTGTALRDHLREVANPPGEVVTEVCQGLDLLRKGQPINYDGASGTVDMNAEGDVTGSYDVWQVQSDGSLKVIETISVTGSS